MEWKKAFPTDCTKDFVERRWTQTQCEINGCHAETPESFTISILHWNMLAQKLCDEFDKIDDDAPILKFANRLRLMKQHLVMANCDIVTMSEVDAMSGKCSQDYMALIQMMAELGYDHQFFEKKNFLSGSGIWYKKGQFNLL